MIKINHKLVATLALGCSIFLGGCASVPMAASDADARAKSFVTPSDGTSNIYIYRDESMGAAIKMPLLLDGVSVGDTAAHTYLLKQVGPGKHTVVSKTENDASLDIDVAAGKNYYVWQEVKMGAFAARSALHLVEESKGQKAVKSCKLIK